MNQQPQSSQPYKGVRDFYPADMAVQEYIFSQWSKTAESFGFAKYDASILEPAQLYKAKGAENEEMVNEQTYTFTDRGNREVTLRPEMTPTVARMVAAKRNELTFPVRWYSIPNLFRYERTQRGRLREHWQLNCDIFGADSISADIEVIAVAYQLLIDMGATSDMFSIRLNDRHEMTALYNTIGITNPDMITAINRLNDRIQKISTDMYMQELVEIVGNTEQAEAIHTSVTDTSGSNPVSEGLAELGIQNVVLDRSIARGFDYYTGTVFEIVDTHPDNNRSMLGGGRYDNLTALFGGEAISGVGFGMGDVTMRDFLETHSLLPADIQNTAPTLSLLTTTPELAIHAQKMAQTARAVGIKTNVDYSNRKLAKKLKLANEQDISYVIIIGEDELKQNTYTLKHMPTATSTEGDLKQLLATITNTSL